MAGILDGKERLIDFIYTSEGKRQATTGQMRVEYATLTDMHTFYEGEYIDGQLYATDPKLRIFFEATDRHQDTIVPELEAGTVMRTFRSSDYRFEGINLASGSEKNGALIESRLVTGSNVVESADALLHSITQNFKELQILGTEDPFSDTTDFVIRPQSVSFQIEQRPGSFGKATSDGVVNLESAPSMFADKRFSHLPNFDYLPPVNVPDPGEIPVPLGVYPRLRAIDDYDLTQLMQDLSGKQSYEVLFDDTSRENNLLMQAFEFSPNGVEKMSAVDFGEFESEDPATPAKRVFFVGKVLKDANDTEVFVNFFTVVAE